MGYYTRVLGTQDPDIHIDELIAALKKDGLLAHFELDAAEQPGNWTIIDILNNDDEVLAQLERNPVTEGELGQEELDEFREKILDCKPDSAVKWLTDYFDKVKVIYAFRMLNAAFEEDNLKIVSSIETEIWNKTNGILQADDEGFSNEDGYHILWQFSDNVTGQWNCAVLDQDKNWVKFSMDLGDETQRNEFQNGVLPKKADLL